MRSLKIMIHNFLTSALPYRLNINELVIIILEFTLVLKQHTCESDGEPGCLQLSVEGCARSCYNRSSMFAYGRLDKKCYGGKCSCWCEISADKSGKCSVKADSDVDLYKFEIEPIKNASDVKGKTSYRARGISS